MGSIKRDLAVGRCSDFFGGSYDVSHQFKTCDIKIRRWDDVQILGQVAPSSINISKIENLELTVLDWLGACKWCEITQREGETISALRPAAPPRVILVIMITLAVLLHRSK